MTPDEFLQNPWKEASAHPLYKESFFNMRPAPEYASGEVLLASLYRNVGFSETVSEGKVPANGREFVKRLDRGRRLGSESDTGLGVDTFKSLLYGALSSPKQPNQTARRFLQLCPLVPDAAIYSLSARLSANSWNPGELIARLIAFGESDQTRVEEHWRNLFHQLSIGADDDVWAKFLAREFQAWRTDELQNAWQPPTAAGSWRVINEWHRGSAQIPAQQFVRDMDHTLSLKPRLTRRQWISLIESVIRLGTASHILWLCRVGKEFSNAIENVLNGNAPATESELRTQFSVKTPFWSYGKAAGHTIKAGARDFVMSRLRINLALWHLEAYGRAAEVRARSISSIPSIASFLSDLATTRGQFPAEAFRQNLLKAVDENPRVVAGKDGIGSNIAEFLRHVLGQRQTSEPGMDSYDQGYYLRKRGSYMSAPWIVSLGPVSVLMLVHCCTHLARGPRTVEDFCRHVANYGIEIRAQDVPSNDLGQTLRNLGLVLDSPDAEGGMVLVSPFKRQIQEERL